MKTNKMSRFLLITLTVLIITVIFGFIINKQHGFIYNGILIYIAYLLGFYYEEKGVIKTTTSAKALLILVIILHLVGGQYLNLYNKSSYFDKGLHLVGTFAVSILTYQVLASLFGYQLKSKVMIFLFVSSLGITSGTLFEIFEFSLDIIFNGNNQKGLVDTNVDMIFNVIGATIAGLIVLGRNNPK